MADEVARRLVHACGALIPAAYIVGVLSWPQVELVLVGGIVVAAVLEFLRLFMGFEHALFDRLTREYEQDNLAGYALYTFSGSLTGIVFEPVVAVPAIFMLTLGDPVSGLLGSGELRTVKRPRVLVAMFLTCLGLAVASWQLLPASLPLVVGVAGAAAATVADGVKPVVAGYVVDDNLTIPIVAAGTMAVVAELVVTGA
jgi:dolichol kinase